MEQVVSLAMPFFGLIFLGFLAGKIIDTPEEGLAWLNTFIIYFALPALFFQLIAKTPFEQLAQWSFIVSTTTATACAFAIAFFVGWLVLRDPRAGAIQGALGAYSNVGYMGPGLTIATLGPVATVPTALIFCFDNAFIFTAVPLVMALAKGEGGALRLAGDISRRVLLHPFIIATAVGVAVAYFQVEPPQAIDTMLGYLAAAAAPCALFTMGVTVAQRPIRRVPIDMPILILVKLVLHPVMVFVLLALAGPFDPVWVGTAILMAALPPALNVFVLAQQYGVYVERASSSILIGTVVSVLTLTAAMYLVTTGAIPMTSPP